MNCCSGGAGSFVPPTDLSKCSKLRERRLNLLDHLVGAGEQRRRNGEVERFRSFEIDPEMKFGRLLHGQVGWLGATEYFDDVICCYRARPIKILAIGEEKTALSELHVFANGGDQVAHRKLNYARRILR